MSSKNKTQNTSYRYSENIGLVSKEIHDQEYAKHLWHDTPEDALIDYYTTKISDIRSKMNTYNQQLKELSELKKEIEGSKEFIRLLNEYPEKFI